MAFPSFVFPSPLDNPHVPEVPMHVILAATRLCAALRVPDDLEDAYLHQASLVLLASAEYRRLADTYAPFANDVAVLEEFAARHGSMEAFGTSAALDDRAAWLREESERLDAAGDLLLHRADGVSSHYRGLAKLRVRAMRRECLSVLTPS